MNNLKFLFEGGIIDPEVQAAPLERIVDFACTIRCDHHEWRAISLDRADLGDRYLEIGEDFQQKGFEFLVAAVNFIDQQYHLTFPGFLNCLQQWPLEQKFTTKQFSL